MTDYEFFRQIQLEWYEDYKLQDLREILQDPYPQVEIFEFEDVPL